MENLNPHIEELDPDVLYHLGLDSSIDLKAMFGNVKYVCMGGSADRAEDFLVKAAEQLELDLGEIEHGPLVDDLPKKIGRIMGTTAFRVLRALGLHPERNRVLRKLIVQPIGKKERFSMFKLGPIIFVNHGMGMPSLSILLHEITKLLYHAGVEDPIFIRVGTSGGVGVEGGDVVVTIGALNGELEPFREHIVLGERRRWPADIDPELAQEILSCAGRFHVVLGKTLGTDDFYEGQGRLDGALNPGYTEADKMIFLRKAHEAGVRNIEMESTEFVVFCRRAGIKCAIVCAALLNRLNGDQVKATPVQLARFSDNAESVVLNFIKSRQ
ncbi:MAG: hypothetical protein ACD_65C00273G0002 [uncultured bacterium]|nr:MAG: hypothetical protein ACD_65C00273G0002 [uncultured bacterium]KKT02977.1 MAG: uridine phosphorylase [Candidatus Peregrinibacteria bacterium GW2011_GWF2_43_17]KKT20472.1 MAG: Uridine phosphorylase [Candidatus Peregrinibacteria bacterium GW2011_GWA2_43_8]HAU40321.1 uridine phosphorylase [Candidatus Peregrinibacteria bacterium]